MWGFHGCCGGWFGALWGTLGVVLIVVIVYLVVRGLGRALPPDSPPSHSTRLNDDPLQILKTRYARGEITREEFERMKRDLLEP